MNSNFFESSNDWGIPDLDLSLQGRSQSLLLPFLPWGAKGRKSLAFPSCIHFYCDDYKFEGLWKRPDKLSQSHVVAIGEPNFSIPDDCPRAIALYQIYRKRWLASYWQRYSGVEIFVDFNVADHFLEFSLLGVPPGWSSYICRGYADKPGSELLLRWHLAQNHSSVNNPLFVVYAGGRVVQELCLEQGWTYFDTFRGWRNK